MGLVGGWVGTEAMLLGNNSETFLHEDKFHFPQEISCIVFPTKWLLYNSSIAEKDVTRTEMTLESKTIGSG